MSESQHHAENGVDAAAGLAYVPGVASHDEVRTMVRDRIERQKSNTPGYSQAQAAREIGVGSSVLSQVLSGTYRGDMKGVTTKLVAWLNAGEAAARVRAVVPAVPQWVETPTSMRIFDALSWAQMMGDIAVIYGGAGLGKTSTIRRYRASHNNVWVMTAWPGQASWGSLLRGIARAIGINDTYQYGDRLFQQLISRVRDCDGLLVIDEAQHLHKDAIETIRSIHDETGVGLALSGNASVFGKIAKGADNGFAQILSRLGKKVPLSKPEAGDVAEIARHFGVTGSTELRRLEDIARRPGALRMVVKTLRLAASLVGENEALADRHICSAWTELQAETINVLREGPNA
jgi:DNA transposition AAA+ family ATPase